MNVIYIEYYPKYDDHAEQIGVAINEDAAREYAEWLKKTYPNCYTKGEFFFNEFEVIEAL